MSFDLIEAIIALKKSIIKPAIVKKTALDVGKSLDKPTASGTNNVARENNIIPWLIPKILKFAILIKDFGYITVYEKLQTRVKRVYIRKSRSKRFPLSRK
ncbi:hypothetical protein HYS97_02915 [Candidatus Daviesbacteria bacterium]|nr:hypothetical protein [Candidatus Daviesbacteria bacterium]